jgi:hypothetical protein
VAARYQQVWELLDISHDRFIRTTDADHQVAVQTFLQKAYDNGHIYKAAYAGWYCVACEAYYDEGRAAPEPRRRRGPRPHPRAAGGVVRGGELVLPAVGVRTAVARLVRGQPRRRAAPRASATRRSA